MPDSTTLVALAARVDSLERQSRRLKILLFTSLVLVLALGAAAGSIAQQTSVSFRDSSGSVKLSAAGLYFYDNHGAKRMFVGLTTANTGLVRMFNASAVEETSLEEDFLKIRDTSGTERVFLGTSTSNDPIMRMYDSSHTERVYAGVYTDGSAGFSAFDSSGAAHWSSP